MGMRSHRRFETPLKRSALIRGLRGPVLALLAVLSANSAIAEEAKGPDWQSWDAAVFEQARAQQRPIFLYLEAVWCHWCHVMRQQTLSDPEIIRQLDAQYISVRVDHDANPLLANRFRDWGWPALIFLDADGREIVKRAGFISPEAFSRLLAAIIEDPSPETAAVHAGQQGAHAQPQLPEALQSDLRAAHLANHDAEKGGLRTLQKFLDRNSLELDLSLALAGEAGYAERAQRTLDAAAELIDPVWGGVYQYSTGARWDRPHYEKIMRSQAGNLRAYALAYAAFKRRQDRQRAQQIIDYLLRFLRDAESGAFYVSQDADLVPGQKAHDYFDLDDRQRRARGIPSVDRNRYADSNGMAIEALAVAAAAAVDDRVLNAALRAAAWVEKFLRLPDGGYRHGLQTEGGYLADDLAMARAQLALYQATGDAEWMQAARDTADHIGRSYRAEPAGFLNAVDRGLPVAPLQVFDENVQLTRFFNLLHQYVGAPHYREMAEHGMRWLAFEPVARRRFEEAGVLLAARELSTEPAHLAVVGSGSQAAELYAVAGRHIAPYARIEWWQQDQGPRTEPDVQYPRFERPAAYICSGQRCSAPSFDAVGYARQISRLLDWPRAVAAGSSR